MKIRPWHSGEGVGGGGGEMWCGVEIHLISSTRYLVHYPIQPHQQLYVRLYGMYGMYDVIWNNALCTLLHYTKYAFLVHMHLHTCGAYTDQNRLYLYSLHLRLWATVHAFWNPLFLHFHILVCTCTTERHHSGTSVAGRKSMAHASANETSNTDYQGIR